MKEPDFRMLSDVINELNGYLKQYGDLPCTLADSSSSNVMSKLVGIFILEITSEEDKSKFDRCCMFTNMIDDRKE